MQSTLTHADIVLSVFSFGAGKSLDAHVGRLFQLHTLVWRPSVHWAIPRVLATSFQEWHYHAGLPVSYRAADALQHDVIQPAKLIHSLQSLLLLKTHASSDLACEVGKSSLSTTL